MASDPASRVPPAGPNDLFGTVYRELRSLAGHAMRQQRAEHTLQPTALVHEVWLKLAKADSEVRGREHFLATATRAMRQVLQDHARARRAEKRGEREPGFEFTNESVEAGGQEIEITLLDDALIALADLNERHARIAELRILGGLTMPEVASVTGIGLRTAELDWKLARAWLRSEIGEN